MLSSIWPIDLERVHFAIENQESSEFDDSEFFKIWVSSLIFSSFETFLATPLATSFTGSVTTSFTDSLATSFTGSFTTSFATSFSASFTGSVATSFTGAVATSLTTPFTGSSGSFWVSFSFSLVRFGELCLLFLTASSISESDILVKLFSEIDELTSEPEEEVSESNS